MPHGVRIASLPDREPYEIGLKLGRPIVRLLDQEARRHEVKRLELVRLLLLRHAGIEVEPLERWSRAPERRMVSARAHAKQRVPITLGPGPLSILLEMANRLGSASKSTIVSHLILDWAGVSPLARGARRWAHRTEGRRRSQPSKSVVLSLATPVLVILDGQARARSTSRADLLRRLIRRHRGDRGAVLPAPRRRPTPIPNEQHDKRRVAVTLARSDLRFLDEIAARLGGGERATIVSHLILDRAGISPLRPGFPFRSAGRRRRSTSQVVP